MTLEAIHHAAVQATDRALEAYQKMRETPGMEESSQKIKDAIRAVVSPMNSAIQTLIRKYPSTAKRTFHHSERDRAVVKEIWSILQVRILVDLRIRGMNDSPTPLRIPGRTDHLT